MWGSSFLLGYIDTAGAREVSSGSWKGEDGPMDVNRTCRAPASNFHSVITRPLRPASVFELSRRLPSHRPANTRCTSSTSPYDGFGVTMVRQNAASFVEVLKACGRIAASNEPSHGSTEVTLGWRRRSCGPQVYPNYSVLGLFFIRVGYTYESKDLCAQHC